MDIEKQKREFYNEFCTVRVDGTPKYWKTETNSDGDVIYPDFETIADWWIEKMKARDAHILTEARGKIEKLKRDTEIFHRRGLRQVRSAVSDYNTAYNKGIEDATTALSNPEEK